MKKKFFKFDYNRCEATAIFEVDLNVFTKEMALETLTFFAWNYNKKADPIEEVMKKYAIQVIWTATINDYNEYGVIDEFESMEGFHKIDGSSGIKLICVDGYQLDEDALFVKIKDI